jgi:hypothetical protein
MRVNQRPSSIFSKKIQLLFNVKAYHYMQSNGRLNDSANNSRLNASHLPKTKKPFTQPATGNRQPAVKSRQLAVVNNRAVVNG